MVIDDVVLLGLGLGAALELLTNQPKTQPETIHVQTLTGNKTIKPVTLDGFDRPHLKFILGDTPEYIMLDSGNPISHLSLTKMTADRINIVRYPKHNDGFVIPVTLPGVGYIPAIKAFIEDRGANLISPMLFTPFYDIEFSKEAIVFDPNRLRPTVPYVHSPDPDVKPVINVRIGASSVDLAIDTGADISEINSEVAAICKIQKYPKVHVPLSESLGQRKQTSVVGYKVPIIIPGAYSGTRTFYVTDIRKSKLSLLSATQFLEGNWRLKYAEYGITFIPPR
jgi:hypothetical protein